MNFAESVSFLEKKGYKVYPRGSLYSVWRPTDKNNDCRDFYDKRRLIKLAESSQNNQSKGHKGTMKLGKGGINCPCCRIPSKVYKRMTKRKERRKKVDLD